MFLNKLKKLDKKTKIMAVILIILILAAVGVVIATHLNKTEEVAQVEETLEPLVVNVSNENLEVEYNTEPTTEAVTVNIKNYDSNYNLYYYIQEIGQALGAEEQQQEATENVQTDEAVQEEEQKIIDDSQYVLYQEGEQISISANSVISFKYERDGKFSEDAYKLEITNIIDNGEESEEATEEELEEEKVDANDKSNNTATYYIKINYTANVVTIYKKDANNEYTVPVKAMVCSTGKATPTSGVYKTSNKYVWKLLNGGVYGQYATRIVGSILFHSVPYASANHDALKYTAYDKLGTKASAGCIRLTVADAKWIYDNCSLGTMVEFYSSSNPGPLGKPSARKISSVVECRNYDPTDPVAGNPWATYKGSTTSTTQNTQSTPTTPSNPTPTTPTTPTNPTTPDKPSTPSTTPSTGDDADKNNGNNDDKKDEDSKEDNTGEETNNGEDVKEEEGKE